MTTSFNPALHPRRRDGKFTETDASRREADVSLSFPVSVSSYTDDALYHGWNLIEDEYDDRDNKKFSYRKDGILARVYKTQDGQVSGDVTWRGVRVPFSPQEVAAPSLPSYAKKVISENYIIPEKDTKITRTVVLGKQDDGLYTAAIVDAFTTEVDGKEKTVVVGDRIRTIGIDAKNPEDARKALDMELNHVNGIRRYAPVDNYTSSTAWGDDSDTPVLRQDAETFIPEVPSWQHTLRQR